MKEINKLFYKTILLIFFIFSAQAESKILSIGDSDAKVTVKVFSSLTLGNSNSTSQNFPFSTWNVLINVFVSRCHRYGCYNYGNVSCRPIDNQYIQRN